jgi:para-nitrobenzyl esterase
MGGLLHTPHTSEVPFVFGNLKEAAGLLGTGPELPQLSRDVMGAWVAFARNGDPDHAHLPHWPRYDATGQQTMILDVTSQVESDPGSPTREMLRGVPLYEYNVDRRSMLHG